MKGVWIRHVRSGLNHTEYDHKGLRVDAVANIAIEEALESDLTVERVEVQTVPVRCELGCDHLTTVIVLYWESND